MALSGSLPQINLGVQGETQGSLHTWEGIHWRCMSLWVEKVFTHVINDTQTNSVTDVSPIAQVLYSALTICKYPDALCP
ncbi:hypothetical protein TNCV_3962661 [Trichonephila clavipes]|nr:hypothetical protein TNCV_3962661 [Trichonephila clavipes]